MSVTLKDVEHIASLARLSFSDDEKRQFTDQLNTILAYIDQLNTLDTSSVAPLAQVIETENVLRRDEVKPGLSVGQALANAPARTEEFFKVPKVIGDK
jgi:aspartyl-tRNA(Asn)/glutamyl-tRNA(Gln) amidotransferase subunit C